jgi:hypothetical protein
MYREQKSYDKSIDFQFKSPFKFLKSLNSESLDEYLAEAEVFSIIYESINFNIALYFFEFL